MSRIYAGYHMRQFVAWVCGVIFCLGLHEAKAGLPDTNWTLMLAKSNQTISFTNPGPQVTTNKVGLRATATSGLPVTFSRASGPGTIVGTNLTFTGSGVVVVVASQAGNANWNPAPNKTNRITVTKAVASVTLNYLSQTYNGSQRIVTATTAPTWMPVVITYKGSTNPPVNAGSYVVTARVNSVIYQGGRTGTLVVAKANQTINFPNPGTQFITNKVGLRATASSRLPVAFTRLSGPGRLVGTNLTFTNVGVVVVTASQAGNTNWNVAPKVTNTITVLGLYTLSIRSAYGPSTPATGVYSRVMGTVLTNSVTNLVMSGSSTQFVCVGWSMTGNNPTTGSTNRFLMTLTNNATLTWRWQTNYWLQAAAGAHGSVNVTNRWYAMGSTVTVPAQAAIYYHFTNWSGTVTGSSVWTNPLSLLMNGSKSITALFEENVVTNCTPEWWLASYNLTNGGVSFSAAATNDVDGDGKVAWEEYWANTVPTDQLSVFKLKVVDKTNATGYVIGWTGLLYSISFSTNNAVGGWNNLVTNLNAQSGTYTDTTVRGTSIWYRGGALSPCND